MLRPQRRGDDLLVKQLDEEVLVYDLVTNRAHALNDSSRILFELCDGTRTAEDLAKQFGDMRALSISESMAIVSAALEQFSHRGLLEVPLSRIQGPQRISRRRLLRQIATTAVAIPVIVSLAAPFPAAALSSHYMTGLSGDPCTRNDQCQSSYCLGGKCSGN